ncbi:MAG: hypothetical protein ACRCYU_00770 [Nocardioides sp.]
MSGLALLGWGGLATVLAMAFTLGAAPVFTVRLIARIYPPRDARRAEIVAEMTHVCRSQGIVRQWQWLGQTFARAACEGLPVRLRERKRGRTGHGRSALEPVALTPENLVRPYQDANRRIETFTAAALVHQDHVDANGPDHPDTLRALCRLAQATAMLDQLDAQLDAAAALAADAAEGLADELGANHPDAVLAAVVRAWISDCVEYRDDSAE